MFNGLTRLMLLAVLCCMGGATSVRAAEPVKTGEKRDTLLYIRTDPPGAKVLINGKEAGSSDGLFRVEPGSGTILVELEGRKPDKRQVIIRANAITRVEMSLDPKEGPKREKKFEPESKADVDSRGPHFIGNFPQGSVELVGITNYPPSEQSKWWNPDGSPIKIGTFLPRVPHEPPFPRKRSVALLIRLKNLPPGTSWPAWKISPSVDWWEGNAAVDAQGVTIDGYKLFCPDFDESVRTANFRVGIDMGPWETVIVQRPSRLGPSTFRRGDYESTVTFLKAEAGDRAGQVSTRVTLTSNEPDGEWKKRLVAVTDDETEHATEIGYRGHNGETLFQGLQPSSIKEFRYQVRPFEWVEFKNVSLRPGQETNVEVPPYNPTARKK